MVCPPTRRWARILIGVDFDILSKIFNQWAQNYVQVDTSEWFGIDGKSIKGTVQAQAQRFISHDIDKLLSLVG
ncbi:putative transposase [Calothrix sp. NIES-2100]|uniref:hypothetical protein n=1 Tax=Calothrix sp. NIES-2100 TaxID=1954172 RepID=UPI000B5F1ADC|nr:putative transposase [Calothrix sp. NIES-2100]